MMTMFIIVWTFLFTILYSNCWSIFFTQAWLNSWKESSHIDWHCSSLDSQFCGGRWVILFQSDCAFRQCTSQPRQSDSTLLRHLIRCRDIEHILRGPVISVFSPPFNISSFMSPWLLLCESFRSGSEHVVVFSLLMLKALAAWGEISHGRLPAEWFESSKQSLRPNVKNFGNEELPWAALCPKITERACVNLSVFFLLPFFYCFSYCKLNYCYCISPLVASKSYSLIPTYNNVCGPNTHVCDYIGRSNHVLLMFY